MSDTKSKILRALWAAGGSMEDPQGGRATSRLMKATGMTSPRWVNAVLGQLEDAGLVERTVDGRRTKRIALTPEGVRQFTVPTPATIDYALLARAVVDEMAKRLAD